jgi:hypothetical protein
MANIFEKIEGVTGEKCLVLGVREALIYPFNVGSWSEIRVGYFYSFTTAESFNAATSQELVTSTQTNYKQAGYWGIKDSGVEFPTRSGSVFIGIGQSPGGGNGESYYLSSLERLQLANVAGGGNLTLLSIDSSVALSGNRGNLPLSHTRYNGSGNYCDYFSQRFTLTVNGLGKTGIFYSDYSESNIVQPYTIPALRTKILGTTYTVRQTGYLTSAFNGTTGENVSVPNSLFVYTPYFNNRLRLHSIVVEKIS